MMSNVIIAVSRDNSFYGSVVMPLYGNKLNIKVKIDTGCSISVFNYKRVFNRVVGAEDIKSACIIEGLDYEIAYGVETGGIKHPEPVTYEEKMACKALKFKLPVTSFKLCGIDIPVSNIHMNFDRTGNNLIGMDILSKLTFHCDNSLIDYPALGINKGDYIFVASPDRDNADFNKALVDFFGLSYLSSAELTESLWRDYLDRR